MSVSLLWHFHQPHVPSKVTYRDFGRTLGNIPELMERANALYKRILTFHLDKKLPLTANITGVLVEQTSKEVVDLFREGLKKKLFELTSTGYTHPLLPFLPLEDAQMQIDLNNKMLEEVFDTRATGFFLPELAYDPWVVQLLERNGFTWTVGDDEWLRLTIGDNSRKLWWVWGPESRIQMVFRDREASLLMWKLGEHWARERLTSILRENSHTLIALDAEVWGLYGGDNLVNLEWMASELQNVTKVSTFVEKKKLQPTEETTIHLPPGTWAHVEEGLSPENSTFANWRENEREQQLWRLIDLARSEVKLAEQRGGSHELLTKAWKNLLLAEASDWFGWEHVPYRIIVGREYALRAQRLAQEA